MEFEKWHKPRDVHKIEERDIDRVPCTHILDNGGVLDKRLQSFHKRLLKIAKEKNNSNEVGILIDIKDWSYLVIKGDKGSIKMDSNPEFYSFLAKAQWRSLIFLHNHPNNTCFSEQDIETFLDDERFYLVTAITNSGNIHIMMKDGFCNVAKIKEIYNTHYMKNGNKKSSVLYILQRCGKYGLFYKFGGYTR